MGGISLKELGVEATIEVCCSRETKAGREDIWWMAGMAVGDKIRFQICHKPSPQRLMGFGRAHVE